MSRQFDVHRSAIGLGSGVPAFLINLQSDTLPSLATVVVAPAWSRRRPIPAPNLGVVFSLDSGDWHLSVAEMAFVRHHLLGPVVGNLSDKRDLIIRAIDRLFTGI